MSTGHLSRERMMALIEADAMPDDLHLGGCESCRAEVLSMRRVLRAVRTVDVPEPSPLFWDHLSRRIHEAVEEAAWQAREQTPWARWLAWAAPLSAAVCIAILAVAFPPPRATPALMDMPAVAGGLEAEADLEWQALLDMVGEPSAVPDGEHLLPPPGSVDILVTELSGEERAALAEVLRRAMEGT